MLKQKCFEEHSKFLILLKNADLKTHGGSTAPSAILMLYKSYHAGYSSRAV
jgi:hypothetical protein